MLKKNSLSLILAVLALFLVTMACVDLDLAVVRKNEYPNPGTFEREIADGNVRFNGTANLTRGECMDPTATVILLIGGSTAQNVNLVEISTITNGAVPMSGTCEKISTDDKHNWPATGVYDPKEGTIRFIGCSQGESQAEGKGYLVGDGFEGEYSCFQEDGSLSYKVAFSAYTRVR